MANKTPAISLGLPVFNGESYVAQAIDSVLQQTCCDFELIITDNASTDRTDTICREYVRRDGRIRYYRNESNLGAAGNFNRAYNLARGPYFKWVAHDDLMKPLFLEECLDVLHRDPSIVLCYPRASIIDEQGEFLENYDFKLNTESPQPHQRFGELLLGHRCFEVFGLIRSDILKKTALIGNYGHGDGVLLAHLALFGRFEEVPDYLFLARKHAEQSMYVYGVYDNTQIDYNEYANWFDPNNKDRLAMPCFRLLREYFRVVHQSPLTPVERLACYKLLLKWSRRRWRIIGGEWKRAFKHCLSPALEPNVK